MRRKVTSRPGSRVAYGRAEHPGPTGYVSPTPDRQPPTVPSYLSYQEAMERFNVCCFHYFLGLLWITFCCKHLMVELERVLSQLPIQSLSSIPPNHDLRQFGRQIALLAGQSVSADELALVFSQKVVSYLFKTSLQIGREMYVSILDRLCQSFPKVAKEAIDWLLTSEDEVSMTFYGLVISDTFDLAKT